MKARCQESAELSAGMGGAWAHDPEDAVHLRELLRRAVRGRSLPRREPRDVNATTVRPRLQQHRPGHGDHRHPAQRGLDAQACPRLHQLRRHDLVTLLKPPALRRVLKPPELVQVPLQRRHSLPCCAVDTHGRECDARLRHPRAVNRYLPAPGRNVQRPTPGLAKRRGAKSFADAIGDKPLVLHAVRASHVDVVLPVQHLAAGGEVARPLVHQARLRAHTPRSPWAERRSGATPPEEAGSESSNEGRQ